MDWRNVEKSWGDRGEIVRDFRESVEACKKESSAPYLLFVRAALDVIDNGHPEAFQALSGLLIDAIFILHFKEERYNFKPDRKGKRTKEAYDELSFQNYIAFAPIWQAYQKFWVDEGIAFRRLSIDMRQLTRSAVSISTVGTRFRVSCWPVRW